MSSRMLLTHVNGLIDYCSRLAVAFHTVHFAKLHDSKRDVDSRKLAE